MTTIILTIILTALAIITWQSAYRDWREYKWSVTRTRRAVTAWEDTIADGGTPIEAMDAAASVYDWDWQDLPD
jgi:hypothetical protein